MVMKCLLRGAAALVLLIMFAACSSSDDNEQPVQPRSIEVKVYESLLPPGDNDYSPRLWSSAEVMLFAVPAAQVNQEQSQLAAGIVELKDGTRLKAAYRSAGVIEGAQYGTYTLLVYCRGNKSNAYLENRYTFKQLEYDTSNSSYQAECLFVWQDMSVNKGFTPWQEP